MESNTINTQQFNDKLASFRALIDEHIADSYSGARPASLYDPIEYIFSAGGKRLRPILTMLACESIGGSPEQASVAGPHLKYSIILHWFMMILWIDLL
jgi:geranylgeranyl pyrophosphate synthase